MARHSGKCLDVRGESTNDGGSIIQWSCNGGANQTWLLRPVTTVHLRLRSLLGSQRPPRFLERAAFASIVKPIGQRRPFR